MKCNTFLNAEKNSSAYIVYSQKLFFEALYIWSMVRGHLSPGWGVGIEYLQSLNISVKHVRSSHFVLIKILVDEIWWHGEVKYIISY